MIKTSPVATTGNDGSIVYVGLDGPSLAAGSSFVYVTENWGMGLLPSYATWGRRTILSVQ